MMKEYNMNKEAHRIYDNTPERKKARNERDRNRRKNDPEYKLKENLKRSFRNFIKNTNVKASWRELYTVEEFRNHIESSFQDGMSWENQGIEWHVDHRIPQSYFTAEQWKECYALENLKPEWGGWNMSKGNRFIGSSEDSSRWTITNRRALK